MAFLKRSLFEANEKNIARLILLDNKIMKRSPIMLPNCFISKAQDNEADVFAIRKTLYTDEFEIKCSRADFLADRKKNIAYREPEAKSSIFGESEYAEWAAAGRVKGDEPWTMNKLEAYEQGLGVPNHFNYVLGPDVVVKDDEIPDWAGVYSVSKNGFMTLRRRAKKLHKNKVDPELYSSVLRKGLMRYLDIERGWRKA